MIFKIVNPFDTEKKYQSIHTINGRSKGVLSANLKLSTNQPNELNMRFDTNLTKDAYNALKDSNLGIRLTQDDIDMVFVQDRASKKIDAQGVMTIRFYSAIYGLIYSEPTLIRQQFIRESGIKTVNRIPDFDFQLISPDVQLTINTGINNNLDILNNIRKASGSWSYIDIGLKSIGDGKFEKTALIGNFNNIDGYADADNRFKTTIVRAQDTDDFYGDSPTLDDLTLYYNGREIQFLHPVLDTGQGAGSANSAPTFTRTNYDFVDPEFPLVAINGKVYIQDTRYAGLEKRYLTYPVTFTATSDNGEGEQILNIEDAYEYLYRKSVFYLKSQRETNRYDAPFTFRKITFPKYYQIKYKKQITNIRGEVVELFDLDDQKLLTSIEYDLTKI